jgi:hypothetical protein
MKIRVLHNMCPLVYVRARVPTGMRLWTEGGSSGEDSVNNLFFEGN